MSVIDLVDWGALAADFFVGIGIVLLLCGFIIVSFSCIGCLGTQNPSLSNNYKMIDKNLAVIYII